LKDRQGIFAWSEKGDEVMKKILMAAALAAGLGMSMATPAVAQSASYSPGSYMSVQGIYVEDGQFENYMDYIADRYRTSQEIAKQKGWISGYRIFANANRRGDEPDLYLLVETPRMATPQEQVERERQMNEAMRQTTRQAEEGSGTRVKMRRMGSNLLLQELNLKAR
jgi:hypothetical protein